MRLGLFGGSFDPIHRGHVEPVQVARQTLDLDRVVYLPTASPPHKIGRELASPSVRYAMVELALLDEPGLEASDFEMTPGATAYTIDSIEHFRGSDGEREIVLLIGLDSLAELAGWRRWQDIVATAEIGVLSRPGTDEDLVMAELSDPFQRARDEGRLRFVENTPIDVSATELRRRLAAGESIPDGSVAPLVLKYLSKYPNLYV